MFRGAFCYYISERLKLAAIPGCPIKRAVKMICLNRSEVYKAGIGDRVLAQAKVVGLGARDVMSRSGQHTCFRPKSLI